MFQAPRPISHAPIHSSYFTPTAAPLNHFYDSPQLSYQPSSKIHSHHITAVPIGVSNAHRPIAINAHRGSGSGASSGPNSANNRTVFTSRAHQDPTVGYSPSASPRPQTQSGSASPAVHAFGLTNSTPNAGIGFSLSTPSPPPNAGELTPASPMMSPSFVHERRDSVDENEMASAHLQGILWRNAAAIRPQQNAGTRPIINPHALASPVHRGMMSPGSSNNSYPTTPLSQSAAAGQSPSGSLTRCIPIAKRGGGGPPSAVSPLQQVSILGQLQQHGSGLATVEDHASSSANSREGSRRGSASGSATQSSLVGLGTSPMTANSLSSSSFISHTPPVRAGNPLDRDTCFSPKQQAEYLLKHAHADQWNDDDSKPNLLPMMLSSNGYNKHIGFSSVHQSPVARSSTLTQSLASRHGRMAAEPLQLPGPHYASHHQQNASYSATSSVPQPLTGAISRQPGGVEQIDEDAVDYPKLSCTL